MSDFGVNALSAGGCQCDAVYTGAPRSNYPVLMLLAPRCQFLRCLRSQVRSARFRAPGAKSLVSQAARPLFRDPSGDVVGHARTAFVVPIQTKRRMSLRKPTGIPELPPSSLSKQPVLSIPVGFRPGPPCPVRLRPGRPLVGRPLVGRPLVGQPSAGQSSAARRRAACRTAASGRRRHRRVGPGRRRRRRAGPRRRRPAAAGSALAVVGYFD